MSQTFLSHATGMGTYDSQLRSRRGTINPRMISVLQAVHPTPRREVRHVDDLERHAVHVQRVRRRRQVLDHELDHL